MQGQDVGAGIYLTRRKQVVEPADQEAAREMGRRAELVGVQLS